MDNNILCLCDDILELVIVEIGHEREKLKNLKKFKSNLKEGLKLIKKTYYDLNRLEFIKRSNWRTDSFQYLDLSIERPLIRLIKEIKRDEEGEEIGYSFKNEVLAVEEVNIIINNYFNFNCAFSNDFKHITILKLLKMNIERFEKLTYNKKDLLIRYNKGDFLYFMRKYFLLYIKTSLTKDDIYYIFIKYLELVKYGEFDKEFNIIKSDKIKTYEVKMNDLESYEIIITKKL